MERTALGIASQHLWQLVTLHSRPRALPEPSLILCVIRSMASRTLWWLCPFILVACATNPMAHHDPQGLVGVWAGASHAWIFYGDGYFAVDVEDGYAGRWRVADDTLHIRFPRNTKEEATKIVYLDRKSLKVSPSLHGESSFERRQ
jgi:hypothetical protein